jgi:hypothetical protein
MFLLVGMLLAAIPGHEGFHVELPLAAFVVHEPKEEKKNILRTSLFWEMTQVKRITNIKSEFIQ